MTRGLQSILLLPRVFSFFLSRTHTVAYTLLHAQKAGTCTQTQPCIWLEMCVRDGECPHTDSLLISHSPITTSTGAKLLCAGLLEVVRVLVEELRANHSPVDRWGGLARGMLHALEQILVQWHCTMGGKCEKMTFHGMMMAHDRMPMNRPHVHVTPMLYIHLTPTPCAGTPMDDALRTNQREVTLSVIATSQVPRQTQSDFYVQTVSFLRQKGAMKGATKASEQPKHL